MQSTLPTADTAAALLSLFTSEFPEGSKLSLLPKHDDQFRARVEVPAGPVTILIPRRLRRFIRERLRASDLRSDVVTVWDYAEAY
jgi:hypothetical protein